ncbi:MAG: hypothetical protein PVG07_01780, partial [Acidobacteriota bacterium]
WEEGEDGLDVAAWGAADPERRGVVLSLLLRWVIGSNPSATLRLVKTGEQEVPAAVADELGLKPGERYYRLVTEAKPL